MIGLASTLRLSNIIHRFIKEVHQVCTLADIMHYHSFIDSFRNWKHHFRSILLSLNSWFYLYGINGYFCSLTTCVACTNTIYVSTNFARSYEIIGHIGLCGRSKKKKKKKILMTIYAILLILLFSALLPDSSALKSMLLSFYYCDMKRYVFDPVTENILGCINRIIKGTWTLYSWTILVWNGCSFSKFAYSYS
ncbi:hypothetical protein K501DRAFT_274111 [Backusella circina FSU 941]|nr:hypothetical protein K501DRAFT_274111 [Backusella circina FSU 941]